MPNNTAEHSAPVTKDMLMGDIIRIHPSSVYALMGCGLGCVSCPSAQGESLEEAAMVHGLDPDEVLEFLNEWIQDKENA
jgi:hybrid cluster-associated redox disulfide protein